MARKLFGDVSPFTYRILLHIHEADAYFYEHDREAYRHNCICRSGWSKVTGNEVERELLIESDARVGYDRTLISAEIRPQQPRVKPSARPERQA